MIDLPQFFASGWDRHFVRRCAPFLGDKTWGHWAPRSLSVPWFSKASVAFKQVVSFQIAANQSFYPVHANVTKYCSCMILVPLVAWSVGASPHVLQPPFWVSGIKRTFVRPFFFFEKDIMDSGEPQALTQRNESQRWKPRLVPRSLTLPQGW